METIKETDDEDLDLHEAQTLINTNGMSELAVRTLEELTKQPGLARKSTFPRNFSTMSFSGNKRRKPSQESIVSSYSRLDFTGSSLQLHLEVRRRLVPVSSLLIGRFAADRTGVEHEFGAPPSQHELSGRPADVPQEDLGRFRALAAQVQNGKEKERVAEDRHLHGFRPAEGPRLPEFGVRPVDILRGRAELQDGDAVLLREHRLRQGRHRPLPVRPSVHRYLGPADLAADLRPDQRVQKDALHDRNFCFGYLQIR